LAVKHEELSHQEIEENDLNCQNHVVDGTCQVRFEKKMESSSYKSEWRSINCSIYSGYSLRDSRIILEKIDKTEKYNELIELHAHVLINITCLKEIVYFFVCKRSLQLMETFPELFLINGPIGIFICKEIKRTLTTWK
jgi:hypothetical protein